jgi:hypothetical protein
LDRERPVRRSENGLNYVGEPFDYLTGSGVDDFSSFRRLGGGAYSPLSVAKPGRPYQPPALYANLIYDGRWL